MSRVATLWRDHADITLIKEVVFLYRLDVPFDLRYFAGPDKGAVDEMSDLPRNHACSF